MDSRDFVPPCHVCHRMKCACPAPGDVTTVRRSQPVLDDRIIAFVGGPYDGQTRIFPTNLTVPHEHWVIASEERLAHIKAGGSPEDEPRYVLRREDDTLRYEWKSSLVALKVLQEDGLSQ